MSFDVIDAFHQMARQHPLIAHSVGAAWTSFAEAAETGLEILWWAAFILSAIGTLATVDKMADALYGRKRKSLHSGEKLHGLTRVEAEAAEPAPTARAAASPTAEGRCGPVDATSAGGDSL